MIRPDLWKYCGKCGHKMPAYVSDNGLWWDCTRWGWGWPWKRKTWDHDIEYIGTVGPWSPKPETPDRYDRRSGEATR